MGDANPIHTLGDYSKPSHEGYRNTIELPVWNNVVSLRSDTIRLVKNGCSFHEIRSEDPNQHLKDFLKLVDSLDLNGANRERSRLRESLSEAWTRFKDLLQKVPHYGIDCWLQIQIFYDHVSFHLKCEIDRAADGKLCDKNADESWEIIENLALYDHEGWNDSKNFLQALGTTFEARVRDYMAAHTERMEIFENAILKQREEINDRMAEMFGLLKELTTSRAPEKRRGRKDANDDVATGDGIKKTNGLDTETLVKEADTENESESRIKNEPIKRDEKGEGVEAPNSQPIEYYLKHRINEKLIEGLVDNQRFNDTLLGVRVGKMKKKTYTLSPKGAVYEAILKKKITRKEDIGGNFEIPCNLGGLKRMNPTTKRHATPTYMKLTTKCPLRTALISPTKSFVCMKQFPQEKDTKKGGTMRNF
ncbi:hypothetical protein Tco_0488172 [Tanacetum coccineum]